MVPRARHIMAKEPSLKQHDREEQSGQVRVEGGKSNVILVYNCL